jgi:hypothetical protein
LSSARRETLEEWGEDIPTTVLFGRLGKALAEHIEEVNLEGRAHIFQVIEDGLDDTDVALKTLVATGFLEALHLRAAAIPGRWEQLSDCLGPRSKSYLIE